MTSPPISSTDGRAFVEEVANLRAAVARIEKGISTGSLGVSSLESGQYIGMYDANGNYRGRLGDHGDGSYGVSTINNPTPPPVPTVPIVAGVLGGIRITTTGLIGNAIVPVDFSHLNVYTTTNESGPGGVVARITAATDGVHILVGVPYVKHRVWLTSVNTSGSESAPSGESEATPLQAVSQDILDGVIDETKLAAEAVTSAKIAAGAVTEVQLGDKVVDVTKLADGSVTGQIIAANAIAAGNIAANAIRTNHIAAGAIQALNIAVGAISTEKLVAQAITSDKIAANAITADKIAANAITATKIDAGSITAEHLRAGIIISDASLQTGYAGKRIVVSGPGQDIRFYPNSDDSRYARILSYIPTDLPNDVAVELRAITSTQVATITKLLVNPNRLFMGMTDAVNQSVIDGAFLELHRDFGMFGLWNQGSTFVGMTVFSGNELIEPSLYFSGAFHPGQHDPQQAFVWEIFPQTPAATARLHVLNLSFTMDGLVVPTVSGFAPESKYQNANGDTLAAQTSTWFTLVTNAGFEAGVLTVGRASRHTTYWHILRGGNQ